MSYQALIATILFIPLAHGLSTQSMAENVRSVPDQTQIEHDEPKEFFELPLSFSIGGFRVLNDPVSIDDWGLSVGADPALYFKPSWGVHIPYTYLRFNGGTTGHLVGGGPTYRVFDGEYVRAHIDGAFLFARFAGGNHLGWSAGGTLAVGLKRVSTRPFIGPYFRYESILLPGRDLRGFNFGLSISLSGWSDLN